MPTVTPLPPRPSLRARAFAPLVLCALLLAPAAGQAAAGERVRGSRNADHLVFSGDVLFGLNDARLTARGRAELDRALQRHPTYRITDLRITGHADHTGSSARNRSLSLQRAEAVRRHLIARGHSQRIEIEGRGELDPVRQCSPRLPRAERIRCLAPNRRVEIAPAVKG